MTTMPKSPVRCARTFSTTPDPFVLEYLQSGSVAKTPSRKPYWPSFVATWSAKPVIYLGTGTCGMARARPRSAMRFASTWKPTTRTWEIVEVGCIGMCAFEPIMDVQLPGKKRLSFMQVSPENVAGILDGVFAGKVPTANLVGQFRAGRRGVGDLPYMDEHSFSSRNCAGCWNSRQSSIPAARGIHPRAADTRPSWNHSHENPRGSV